MFKYRTKRKNLLKAEIIKDLLKDESLKDIVNNIDMYIDARMEMTLSDKEDAFAAKIKSLKFETIKSFNQANKTRKKDNQEIIKVIQRIEKNLLDEIRVDRMKRDRRETTNKTGREY